RFLAGAVPSLGYRVFHAAAAAHGARPRSPVSGDGTTIENEFFRVAVDPRSGCITELFDKRNRRSALAPGSCGNLLQTFVDKPRDWDAWNIDADFEKQTQNLERADEVRLAASGPLSASVRVVRTFQHSRIVQEIRLTAGVPRVDTVSDIDWRAEHV